MSEMVRVRMGFFENNVQVVDFESDVITGSDAENMIARMVSNMTRHHKMHLHGEFDVVTVGTKWFTDDSGSKWGVIMVFDGDK